MPNEVGSGDVRGGLVIGMNVIKYDYVILNLSYLCYFYCVSVLDDGRTAGQVFDFPELKRSAINGRVHIGFHVLD